MPNVTAQTLLFAIGNTINWTLISENRLLLPMALRQTLVVSTITFSLKKYSPWCPQMLPSAPIKTVLKYLLALVTHGTALTRIVLFRSRGGWHLVCFHSGWLGFFWHIHSYLTAWNKFSGFQQQLIRLQNSSFLLFLRAATCLLL